MSIKQHLIAVALVAVFVPVLAAAGVRAASTCLCCNNPAAAGEAIAARIHDIQGVGHVSPLTGCKVTDVYGIVTLVRSDGFFMQDPQPDNDPASSEGIFVFSREAPSVAEGDAVQVSGRISEFRPAGKHGSNNLSVTQISRPAVRLVSSGNALPAPIVIGVGGRLPPARTIYLGSAPDLDKAGPLQPAVNAVDFYESLEGMRVQLNQPVASGPTDGHGELVLLPDAGIFAATRSARGGVVIASDDFNPERIILGSGSVTPPIANVGDGFERVVGVLDYSYGHFTLRATQLSGFAGAGLVPETTRRQAADELAVASFNVENLSPGDPATKFDRLAREIVGNLQAPDILALMEIQDNSGPANDGTVDATRTFSLLIDAIARAGGPTYQFRSISPINGQDGGQPGGNIRQGLLFNAERVSFIDRPGGDAGTPVAVVSGATGVQLSLSPGRIAPLDQAFAHSRKPLAGEFSFQGRTLFLIANHWNSKDGDQALYGRTQPPQRPSELQRGLQAGVVADFVKSLLNADANANARVLVLGDLNDFEFSGAVGKLKLAGLRDLVDTLAPNERYTYVFEGNAEVLDHILVSPALASAADYDIVHVNSEFADQASDHEPEVVRLRLPAALPVNLSRAFTWRASGLRFDRATGTYAGTISLIARQTVSTPLVLALSGLPAGVSLLNADLKTAGRPAIRVAKGVAAGQSLQVPVRFGKPAEIELAYQVFVYGGV